MQNSLVDISVVVIGYNEGRHLDDTFTSILNSDYPIEKIELIYVDSGSSDNSVEIASKYCDKIFIENEWPSAARNRNRGLIEGSHEIMHFLDGDIIIDKDYLKAAVQKLLTGEVQCVFGYLEEKHTNSIGNILLHDYRNRKPGYINAPGAGGTFLRSALVRVNGWDERIRRGEETELGNRFLKEGFKIWFLENRMGIHDYGIRTLRQFLRKQVKEGCSNGLVSLIPSTDPFFVQMNKISRNNFIFHLLVIAVSVYLILWFRDIYRIILSIAGLIMSYLLFLFLKYRVVKKIKKKDTLIYFFLTNLTRAHVLFGFLKMRLSFLQLNSRKKESFFKRMNIRESMKK